MSTLTHLTLRVLLALLFAGSMWFYVQHVLIPHQQAEAARYSIPRGNLSDLYPRWLGARELLLHRRDPYSADVTREIQAGYYGRPLDRARVHDPLDEQGFAYPAYVVFLLAPTINLPFAVVQAGFRWLLMGLTLASLLVWLRLLRWSASLETVAVLSLLTLGSFPVLQGIKLQQLTLLVAGLIASSALLLARGQLFWAGIVLALATIKPQLTLPLAAWFTLWVLGDWNHRRNFCWGFGGTMLTLAGGAEFWLPGWIGRFYGALENYRRYNQGAASILDSLMDPRWGKLLALLIVASLGTMAWRYRRAVAGSEIHNWMTGLILAATVIVIPKASPYNQVLLLPGIMLVAQQGRKVWKAGAIRRTLFLLFGITLAWPWMTACGLWVASALLPAEFIQGAWALPLYTSMAIPIALLGLLASGLPEGSKTV